MPTVSAPTNNNTEAPQKPVNRQAPPKPMTSSVPTPVKRESNISAILFVIATLTLCGLLGIFLFRSAKSNGWFALSAPVLDGLPEYTNVSMLEVKGTAPKNARIVVTTDGKTFETKANKQGQFTAVAELKEEKNYTFTAVATKKFLFWTRTSPQSNTVSTTRDVSAPNLKITKLPKTVTANQLEVKGSASEDSQVIVKVNDKETKVTTDKDGNFAVKVELKEGKNTISITVKDKAGNETAASATEVTYVKGSVTSTRVDSNGKPLPESAGILTDALNALFSRYFGIAVLALGALGYFVTTNVLWLVKAYGKRA